VVVVLALVRPADAGQASFATGAGTGYLDVDLDDFGFYGRQQSMMTDDNYWPTGEQRATSVTFMGGSFLFVTTPGPVTSAIALTNFNKFWSFAEPGPQTDGIAGMHTALTRTVTSANVVTGNSAASAFRIADAPSQMQLDFNLAQQLVPQTAPVVELIQSYTVKNNGTVPVDIVMYAFEDADLYFGNDSSWTNDVVGAGPGLCYVYQHQPGHPEWGISLRDGGGTVAKSYYVASKGGYLPDPGGPPMAPMNGNATEQYVFNSWSTAVHGMPTTWRNNVAVVGYNMPGEDTTGFDGDGSIALEYRLTLAVGQTETIKFERWYGTDALPCGGGVLCGNGVVDSGEACDTSGADTTQCNGVNCTSSTCGDGVLNAAAGEQCESLGIDSAGCNGATCMMPACGDGYLNLAAGELCDDGKDTASCNVANCQAPACGDGIVNFAAGEECEDGTWCDVPSCQFNFSVGGGCAGCASGGGGGGAWWLVALAWLLGRRRRSATILALLFAATTAARAQAPTDQFGIERFHLPTNNQSLLDVDWADVPGHTTWGVGMYVGFAHDPLVLYDANMGQIESLVGSRVTTGLVGSVGLFDRFELGLGLDVVGYQSGASGSDSPVMADLPAGGLGDLRIAPKALVLGGAGAQLHVAVIAALTVPAGSAHGYLREAGPAFAPEVAVSGTWNGLRGGANLGYVVRKRVDDAGLLVDDEAFARIAVGYRIAGNEVALSGSVATPVSSPEKNQVALQALLGASRGFGSLTAFVAGGIGLDNGFGVPDWRALAGVRYDGVRGDRDQDGLVGAADRCPNEPEDKDGFQDDDGCPDPDNDGDGVADAQDRCPTEAEDHDGVADDDGCPDGDDDHDGVADDHDKCPKQAEDKDGFQDDDGCPDPSGKLTGKIVDDEGRPIAHATLSIDYVDHPGTAPGQATTGDDGSFAIDVHGGAMQIAARADGYQDGGGQVRVEPNHTGTLSLKLAHKVRQGQLRGQVLSFDGKPLAATITVTGKSTANVSTDAEGFFTIDLPAGAFDVSVEAKGFATQHRKVSIKLDGVTVLNVDMRGP